MARRGHGTPSAAITAVEETLRSLVTNDTRRDRGVFHWAGPGDSRSSEPPESNQKTETRYEPPRARLIRRSDWLGNSAGWDRRPDSERGCEPCRLRTSSRRWWRPPEVDRARGVPAAVGGGATITETERVAQPDGKQLID